MLNSLKMCHSYDVVYIRDSLRNFRSGDTAELSALFDYLEILFVFGNLSYQDYLFIHALVEQVVHGRKYRIEHSEYNKRKLYKPITSEDFLKCFAVSENVCKSLKTNNC